MIFQPPEQEEIGLVQGIMPDSKEEWWVAKALWKHEVPFMFQYELFHGRSRLGGVILDFLVWNPQPTPLPVHGEYWHEGNLSGDDRKDLVMIADYFNIGVENIPILWGKDAQTEDDVSAWVRDNIAR